MQGCGLLAALHRELRVARSDPLMPMSWDNTPPSPNTISFTPTNTAPSPQTLSGFTPDNTPTVSYSDNFSSGSQGQPLGSPWILPAQFNYLPIYGVAEAFGDANGNNAALVQAVSVLDGYIQAKIIGASGVSQLFARFVESSGNYYSVKYTASSGTLELFRVVSGVPALLTTVTGVTFTPGYVLRLECLNNLLRAYYGGTLRATYTDPTPLANPGTFGIWLSTSVSGLDDFICGRMGAQPNSISGI